MRVVLLLIAILVQPASAADVASYYSKPHHGKVMASGKIYNMWKMTCAHESLPFGTIIKVTNLLNQRSVVLTVTDRGPYYRGRTVDVSYKAAIRLKMVKTGVVPIRIKVIRRPNGSDLQHHRRESGKTRRR